MSLISSDDYGLDPILSLRNLISEVMSLTNGFIWSVISQGSQKLIVCNIHLSSQCCVTTIFTTVSELFQDGDDPLIVYPG